MRRYVRIAPSAKRICGKSVRTRADEMRRDLGEVAAVCGMLEMRTRRQPGTRPLRSWLVTLRKATDSMVG